MADATSIAIRHQEALKEVTEILERHDPEVGERIRKAKGGHGFPNAVNSPRETAAFHAECMASLARLVDEHLTPKKRGRPRKTDR